MTEPGTLPSWADQMKALDGVVENLISTWRPDGATDAEVQDMNKLALSILASGYMCHVYTDATRPVFMPLWNYACNQGGPNPDYVYSTTEVDPTGTYRISGYRGSTRFVDITQQAFDILDPSVLDGGARLNVTNDLDELTIDEDGYFSVVLSAERPAGHDGDWWRLDPQCRSLLMRKCSCDWKNEVDARVAVERLDEAGADMSPAEIARRISELARWVEGTIEFDMRLVRYYLEHHGVNVLLRSTKIDDMSGLPKQAYYDGIYEIDDDEALIVEYPIPAQCKYWQILVSDDRFATVDWVNRQSSLNDAQARVDSDGWFRAVVSKRDPGVYNWLDKADFPWGVIQARFYLANEYPDATVTRVPVAEVLEHLPPGTPTVTPTERQEQLGARRRGAQLRRIW